MREAVETLIDYARRAEQLEVALSTRVLNTPGEFELEIDARIDRYHRYMGQAARNDPSCIYGRP